MKVFGVNFDIGYYLEIEADSPEEAESIAKEKEECGENAK